MPTSLLRSVTPTIDVYIKLAQYPILCDKIRLRMREELFRRGVVEQGLFEQEVHQKAVESMRREGLFDPFDQEDPSIWQERKRRIRDFQTDAYFANNLGSVVLETIIEEVLSDQPGQISETELTFNPEIAPWNLLFQQGEIYEQMPPPEREKISHHLEEIKVVLIKRMISDQLPFIGVARKIFSIADLKRIYNRRIGTGKIGGKSAGMTLAWKILQQQAPAMGADISAQVDIPDSFFIGTEVIYEFRLLNNLDNFMNQKYRSLEEIRGEYPRILEAHMRAQFPEAIVEQLQELLSHFGDSPLIVRSSSLLEDNFGFSFAGKYDSYFCPNQGTPEENLSELLDAIRRVFASTLSPDAILYRKQHQLIDYDERMAILVQRLHGQRYDKYFMPTLAGVGFSQNPFRWNPKIRREDGFLRLVCGMGTRAVDRVDNDYPRMIALSHPQLRPETSAKAIRQYSQWYIDVVDLEENCFKTIPAHEILDEKYPFLRYVASLDKGDYLQDIVSLGKRDEWEQYVLTFDYLTKDRDFVRLMRTALMRLEQAYGTPVDVEYTVDIVPDYPYPKYHLNILQCRPLSQRTDEGKVLIPSDIPQEDILFSASGLIPEGRAEGVQYVVFIDPLVYQQIPERHVKLELGRIVSRLNRVLKDESFILMGPGRWGSSNLELGVRVTYADIYNTKVLVELGVEQDGMVPELSYGTHFFQDLVESGIHSLAIQTSQEGSFFDWSFFRESPNQLGELLPQDAPFSEYVRVLDVPKLSGNRRLSILMDGEADEVVCFLEDGRWVAPSSYQDTLSTF